MAERDPHKLITLVNALEHHIAFKDQRKASVSSSDVAWQIDHALKVINLVSKSLVLSNPEDYRRKFNTWRFLLFNLNYIPRGRAKAPKMVRPPDTISKTALNDQVQLALKHIAQLRMAKQDAFFKHFVFGVLNKNQTIRFLELHTTHHLKIIRDILK